jgi:hypothetical protein
MRKSKLLVQSLALASAVVLGGSPSAWATVDMTFTWSGSLWQANYSATYINTADAIGIYAFNTSPAIGVGNPPSSTFYSVCLSPAGLLNTDKHTYDVKPFGGGTGANPGIYPSSWAWNGSGPNPQYWGVQNAAYLWNTFGMKIVNNTASAYTGNQSSAAAALEFAVWTALYNSIGYGQLGTPTTYWAAPTGQMDSTTRGFYTADLLALTSAGSSIPHYTGNILEGQGAITGGANSGQSQEFFMLGTPVPEPTTMVAGALLLLPFGASTLRFLRKNRAA